MGSHTENSHGHFHAVLDSCAGDLGDVLEGDGGVGGGGELSELNCDSHSFLRHDERCAVNSGAVVGKRFDFVTFVGGSFDNHGLAVDNLGA